MPVTYLVTFDANGGAPVPPPQMVPYGGKVARPADPIRPGYIFTGWYTVQGFSVAPWDFNVDVVTGDMTLRAGWTQAMYMTVTFDANGGAPTPASQTILSGERAIRPVDPFRSGYVFVAWYPTPDFSGSPWNFDSNVVSANMTLYARWMPVV